LDGKLSKCFESIKASASWLFIVSKFDMQRVVRQPGTGMTGSLND